MGKYSFSDRQDERREARRPVPKSRQAIKVKPVKIKPVSDCQKEDLKIYSILRKDYLKDNIVCKAGLENCSHYATTVHHKKLRGKYLNVVEFFMAVCLSCHMKIHEHSKISRELGFLLK